MATNPEGVIQRNLIKWRNAMATDWPDLWMLHSVPNGYKMGKPKKNPKTGAWSNPSAAIAKAEGLLSGVWDLCFPLRRVVIPPGKDLKDYHDSPEGFVLWPGCYLETKQSEYYTRHHVMAKKNPDQLAWGDAMMMQGWQTLIYWEWPVAARFLVNYICYNQLNEGEQEDAIKGVLRYRDAMDLSNRRRW